MKSTSTTQSQVTTSATGRISSRSLRTQSLLLRTSALSALVGLVLCLLLASLSVRAIREQEFNLREESLMSGIDEMQAHLDAGSWPDLHNNRHVVSALRQRTSADQFATEFRTLDNGLHELPTGRYQGFAVMIVERGSYQLLYGIDYSAANQAHRRYLRIGVGLIAIAVLIAAALGYFYARRLALRVKSVADQVIQGSHDHSLVIAPARISEIDTLVDAINQYRSELAAARVSEQSFLADVSHALRTPVAVLQSSLDLLGQEHAGTPAWQRADRNVRDLRLQLDALLLSARSIITQAEETIALPELIDEVLQTHPLRAETVIDVDIPVTLRLQGRTRVLRWVIQQSLRGFDLYKLILVRWHQDRLIIRSSGNEAPQLPAAHLLERVCAREQWQLEIEGDQLQLIFPVSASANGINRNLR